MSPNNYMGRFRKATLIVLLACVFLLTSCIKYKEEVWLNKDFSGKLRMEVSIPAYLVEGKQAEEPMSDYKKQAENIKGVRILKEETKTAGDYVVYTVVVAFDSLEALKNIKEEKGSKGKPKPFYDFTLIKDKSGYKLVRQFDVLKEDKKTQKEDKKTQKQEDQLGEAMAQAMFAQVSWEFILHTPYEIKQSNGLVGENKKTVRWQYSVLTLMKNGAKMEVVMKKPSLWDKIKGIF